jgi:methionyl-tRNA formyltransferase
LGGGSVRIIFMGTGDFAIPSLRAIHASNHSLAGVITQPDRPKGRGRILSPPPVKIIAQELGYQVFQPERIRDGAAVRQIRSWNPEVIVVVAYGQLLPGDILEMPSRGCINVHASLLPKYRGPAPIHRAIIDGEEETGVTTMFMAEALDAGDIILQEKIPINPQATTGILHDLLSEKGAELLMQTLDLLERGEESPLPQEEALATYASLLTPGDEKIDWSRPAAAIMDLIRGMNPWPGAYTTFQGKRLKIWEGKPVTIPDGAGHFPPGSVLPSPGEEGILVKAGDGMGIIITQLQLEGKRAMSTAAFLKGNPVLPGTVLGSVSHEN